MARSRAYPSFCNWNEASACIASDVACTHLYLGAEKDWRLLSENGVHIIHRHALYMVITVIFLVNGNNVTTGPGCDWTLGIVMVCAMCKPPYHHASTSGGIWKQGLALECFAHLSCITQSGLHPCSWATWCDAEKTNFFQGDILSTALCFTVVLNDIWNVFLTCHKWACKDACRHFHAWFEPLHGTQGHLSLNTQSTGFTLLMSVLGFKMTLFLHYLWIHGPKIQFHHTRNGWNAELLEKPVGHWLSII